MSFYAEDFIFDGHPSQEYGLTISSNSPEDSTDASSDVTLLTEHLYRRPVRYLLGVDQDKVLSFPISLNSESYIPATFAPFIARKLFGRVNGYRKLQVIAPDYSQYYWNCFLLNPKLKTVGGQIVGWDATVECDSGFAWSFARSNNFTFTPPISNYSIVLNNRSGNNDYTKPNIVFTMSNVGGTFTIVNTSDANRTFQFTTLSANEVVTVNNDLEIITSSTGLLRLSHFNKKFFRLIPEINSLLVSGNVASMNISWPDAQKIGG